ncbi:MAG: hypothetical protein LBS06_07135 [Treponema sp.]|jgi:hypothetical protein|nr:hypothetical protein [Treponema sp.]
MNRKIYHFDLEGKRVLGFDTGLSPQAFAQAKMAQAVTDRGFIVVPGGGLATWRASGVAELPGDGGAAMVIWGPPFEGRRLDLVIGGAAGEKGGEEALDCLRYWIDARAALGEDAPPPWPAGAFVRLAGDGGERDGPEPASPGRNGPQPRNDDGPADGLWPAGTVFFPPERLVMRCLQAEGDGAWRDGAEAFVHPDLEGKAAAAFCAGAMLYRIFAGRGAFSGADAAAVHQDMREGVFLPPRLAAPGLDGAPAALMESALAPAGSGGRRQKTAGSGGPREEGRKPAETAENSRGRPAGDRGEAVPFPGGFTAILGPPGSKPPAAFVHPLPEAEAAKIEEEKERYLKKRNISVGARRFVIRNTALITGIAAAALILFLIVRSIIAGRAGLPDTGGMGAFEVAETYYQAIGALDHQMMEACVTGKAGKDDIDMVTRFYVLNKVREAYEPGFSVSPAQEWIDAGAPAEVPSVFGVSGLRVEKIREDPAEARFAVEFTLWVPEASDSDEAPVPAGQPCRDEITLTRVKGNWRISAISRTLRQGPHNEQTGTDKSQEF